MDNKSFYHKESRQLQDQFDTRRLADKLEEMLVRKRLTDEDKSFIEEQAMFFLATTDSDGFPECSYKGGAPGFVRVVNESTLIFPSYDGNGMFRSLGNLASNAAVGMLFINFQHPKRLRINGFAKLSNAEQLLEEYPEAQIIVEVTVQYVFPNCPRYIHKMQILEESAYIPHSGRRAPIPGWKMRPEFNEVLPEGDPAKF